MIKGRKKTANYMQYLVAAACILFVVVCYQSMAATGKGTALGQIGEYFQKKLAVSAWKDCMPVMFKGGETEKPAKENRTVSKILASKIENLFPVSGYIEGMIEYDIQIESNLEFETVLEENRKTAENQEAERMQDGAGQNEEIMAAENKIMEIPEQQNIFMQVSDAAGEMVEKVVEIPREKLNDFDYLIHNFYQVDRTTTIDGTQLNVDALLGKSMKLTGGNEAPQILIYHTHSQEGYADSAPGDASASVVGVGEYLTTLLRDKYGFNVIHHTGEYDVKERDNAYSYAGPAVEQILAENQSIEVVIDLHRDGVADTTHLVSEVNGKQTAQVMFFNGLSRTTKNGELTNLPNPYLADNLAFSFQMKLAADEYYPGFTRSIYLKGYRYNMHYCPKSLLVEVGAQTNTLQEAMNAMEPLADLLHKVLTQ